ncbi:C2 family cysteine protease [Streptomyces sp. B6B3]|uniref:C2 family cysteine protease n=1 Tax=Streptomyces sp. B6B3 TaxID=3153570 RepID=UPI00325E9A21
MSYRGFDVGEIRSLAGDLSTLGDEAPTLHLDIATVLNKAHTAMATGPATYDGDLEKVRTSGVTDVVLDGLPFGGSGTLPLALNDDLSGMSSEMRRRCDQLDAVKGLDDAGYPVSSNDLFLDESPPSKEDIDEAVRFFDNLNDSEGLTEPTTNEQLLAAMEDLEGLSAAELNIVLSKVPEGQLEEWNDLLNQEDILGLTGVSREERNAHLSDLFANVGANNIDKFMDSFPGVQPDFSNGEGLDGSEEWGIPPSDQPMFENGTVSADDINQGDFNDCWFLAPLASLAESNPDFIREGIRENDNGTVSVRLWDAEGNMQWVTVSAELPLDENGDPVSASDAGQPLWPAYYEKAFAQVYGDGDGPEGTYAGIEWDYQENAVPYLTGGEGEDISSGFWDFGGSNFDNVKEAFENGKAVTVSSTGDAPDSWEDQGYIDRHVYYVVGFTDDGNILLGNPWGSNYDPIEATPEEFEDAFDDPTAASVS